MFTILSGGVNESLSTYLDLFLESSNGLHIHYLDLNLNAKRQSQVQETKCSVIFRS